MRIRHQIIGCLFALVVAGDRLAAQELRVQPTPFSVWLDFEELGKADVPKGALPIWIEEVVKQSIPARDGAAAKTLFRIRLRRVGSLNSAFQLRLFFFDQPGGAPVVTGWTETGLQPFSGGALGAGLDLPSSASLIVPAAEIDYLDIDVPGDGTNLRGAFLSTLQKHETRRALDFPSAAKLEDAFGNIPEAAPAPDDVYLYGRVRATVDAGILKLTAVDNFRAQYGFELEERPTLAVCTFDVLNADPLNPPLVSVNGKAVGRAFLHLPDLADPGFRSKPPSHTTHYTGWLRAQVVIRGPLLSAGLNNIVLRLDGDSEPVAVRAVELQLKYVSNPNRP